jgi:rare lipoprotein A
MARPEVEIFASSPLGRAIARGAVLAALAVLLGGCASSSKSPPVAKPAGSTSAQAPASASGRYYLDDGPGERPISELEQLPDAVPRADPLHPRANRPYVVFGRSYQPMTRIEPFRERGIATWYGRRYHDRPTSIGERYDMYAMTAAHPRLPLPSYARVTHLRNGRTVVVRVNDRGPFLNNRVIDLSYAAAARLGMARGGSAEVEVELITDPEAFARALPAAAPGPVAPAPAGPVASVSSGPSPASAVAPISVSPAAPAGALPADPVAVPAVAPAAGADSTTLPRAPSPPARAATSVTDPAAIRPGAQIVQIGAFASHDNAHAALRGLESRLRPHGYGLAVRTDGRVHRLIAGPFAHPDQARDAAAQIRTLTGLDAFARRL